MDHVTFLVAVVIVTALAFDFTNGFHDTANAMATSIATGALTSWAAIIAVPTAITGYYGQNLPHPGFGRESGCVTSAAVIVVLSALLYATFKRKDWL